MASDREPTSPRQRRRRKIFAIVGGFAVAILAFVFFYFEPHKAFIDDEVHETIPGLAAVVEETSTTSAAPVTPVTPDTTITVATSPMTGESTPVSTPDSIAPTSATEVAPATSAPPPPTAPAAPGNSLAAAVDQAAATGAPVIVSTGEFFSGEHTTTGTALVVVLPDGSLVVRFEDLDTSNGPDLRVVLSPEPASDAWDYDGREHLGELKGNIGDQNYDIDSEIDLTQFKSVVIWCERFSVAFGAASIDVVA